MQTKVTIKRIMGSVLVGGMLLSLGGIALAASDDTTQANPVKQFFAKKGMGMRGFNGVQDTAKLKENLQQTLAGLVSKGTLTQAKADNVVDYFVKQAKAKQAEFEKIKAMTEEERQAYFEKNKVVRQNPLSELVTNGVITQAEADAISEVMPHKGRGHGGFGKGMMNVDPAKMQTQLKQLLADLVSKGTLTQAKADKVVDYFTKHVEARQAEFEKIKAMTEEERQAYFEKNKLERKEPLSELVSNGIITQEEADAIAKLMPQKGAHKGKMRNGGMQNFKQQTGVQQTSLNTL